MMEKLGMPLPSSLQKKKKKKEPKSELWMQFYIGLHSELSSERSIGMGPGSIPVSAIHDLCYRYGFSLLEFHEIKYFISRLEEVWFEWWEKESERKSKDDPRKTQT